MWEGEKTGGEKRPLGTCENCAKQKFEGKSRSLSWQGLVGGTSLSGFRTFCGVNRRKKDRQVTIGRGKGKTRGRGQKEEIKSTPYFERGAKIGKQGSSSVLLKDVIERGNLGVTSVSKANHIGKANVGEKWGGGNTKKEGS